jgi:hypothetical protein
MEQMKHMKKAFMLAVMVSVALLAALAGPVSAWAADAMWRMMHGEQDALILGEIVAMEDGLCTIAVSDNIVCEGSPRQQLKTETVTISAADMRLDEAFYSTYQQNSPQVGNYVFASLNRRQDGNFKVVWAFCRVNSLDKANLSLVIPEDELSAFWQMDGAARECFIHSDGEIAAFYFDGDLGEVGYYLDGKSGFGEHVVIYNYDPSPSRILGDSVERDGGADSGESTEVAEPGEANLPEEAAELEEHAGYAQPEYVDKPPVLADNPAGEQQGSGEDNIATDDSEGGMSHNYISTVALAAALILIGLIWPKKKQK